MTNQTNNTKMGKSIENGSKPKYEERKGMRVIDFTQARTQAEKQELFSECRSVMQDILFRRQVK